MREKKEVLQWHPSFFADIQVEFRDELDKLEFESEHQLGTKPKEIDVLIIKKDEREHIQKNIGRIFRKYNIVEYKSPTDYLKIADYFKVYGYACFYLAQERERQIISPKEITITYVCHSYPKKLMKYLKWVRRAQVVMFGAGIYYVYGEAMRVQIIVTQRLDKKENLWLGSLTNKLRDIKEVQELLEDYRKHSRDELYSSIINIIFNANRELFGGKSMKTAEEIMEEILEDKIAEREKAARDAGIECGIERGIERGVEQGRENTLVSALKSMIENLGISVEHAMQVLMIPEEEYNKYRNMV